MGKVVTYAIGFANRSPLGEEIKQCIREYQRYLSLENKTEAANTAVQIAESLYDQCEAIDQTLPEKDRLRDENNSLKKSLQYSEKALKTFKEERNEEQQARVLINMSKCYLKLYDYTLAILKSKEALKLYQEYNETDKYTLQSAFKLLGQIYFSKGFSADAARYDDFSNAHRFYEKEHCILKTMTAHDVDGDPNSLLILKQSSHFNMGVIQSKLPEYRQQGLKSLAICLKEAQDLELVDSQKQVLWETAQIYAGKGDYEMVKRCQEKEHNIARNNKNKEDEMNCLVARSKPSLLLLSLCLFPYEF
ncbi:hypothetical protein K501DRAFT_191993 [Backusella circina FSU 941]|nr:hypothetical protein K501DRAFT_191993 [Backusella circina FSU 941]